MKTIHVILKKSWLPIMAIGTAGWIGIQVGSFQSLMWSAFVWFFFSLPGLLLISRLMPMNWPLLATSSLVGVASSIFGIAVFGSFSNYFGATIILAVPITLSVAALKVPIPNDYRNRLIVEKDVEIEPFIPFLLALILMAGPYLFVGKDTLGGFCYTAFFNADFFKHSAYTYAIALGELPPIDIFSNTGRLHYYWLQYLIPASVLQLSGKQITAQEALLTIGLFQTMAMILVMYGVCRQLGVGKKLATLAVSLGILSLTLDGLGASLLHPENTWVETARSINLEARDFTELWGATSYLSGSTLFRLCLYAPQHQLALSFFCAWALLFLLSNKDMKWPVDSVRLVLILPLMGTSFILGTIAAGIIAGIELFCWLCRIKRFPATMLITSCGGFLFCLLAGIIDLSGTHPFLSKTVPSPDGRAPIIFRLLWSAPQVISTFGGLVIIGIIGAVKLAFDRRIALHQRLHPGAAIGIGLAAMIMADMLLDRPHLIIDVQIKASYIVWIGIVFGAAWCFQNRHAIGKRGKILFYSGVLLMILGVATPIQDVVWHTTFTPEVTTCVPRADMKALNKIRTSTPLRATFQQYPEHSFLASGLDSWVPIFGGRSLYASWRGSNMKPEMMATAWRLFHTADGSEVFRMAREANINYLYISKILQPRLFPFINSSLAGFPEFFQKIYDHPDVVIWEVSVEK